MADFAVDAAPELPVTEPHLLPAWFARRPPSAALEYRTALTEPTADGFTGYASTFMAADAYLSCFARGCFKKSLKDRGERLPVLWNHDPAIPIGRHTAIREDRTGLAVEVALVDDGADGSTTLKRLRAGVPLGLSFGFTTLKDRSAADEDEIDLSQLDKDTTKADIRVITEVRLWESSVVTFPANEQAVITAVRSQLDDDALAALLAALETGDVDERQRSLAAEIAAAYALLAAPAEHATHEPVPADDEARRHILGLVALARSQVITAGGIV
ncbi:MAG TPA: HK97 family phage prohead protease [Tepidisphaeraceae bacterium]|jgi:hypothetical protein